LSLVTGKPVDINGKHLFEEAKKKVNVLNSISLGNAIYIDLETQLIIEKESSLIDVDLEKLNVLHTNDFVFIENVFNIINSEIHKSDFDLEKLNLAIGLSKSQSHKRIKSITGLAPGRFIQKLRLYRALDLVKNSNKTIAEIAYDLGFNSPTYFTRVFKKEFNLLPTSIVK
jgi:AraC-like DNA-binding protein